MTITASAVAAFGLPTRHEVEGAELVDDALAELTQTCEAHRVLGLLARAVRHGKVHVTPDGRAALEESYRAWLTHSVRVEQMVIDATRALDRERIPSRVLKGVALSHTAYDDPADRVFGDVDLLVPADQFTRASEVLATALDGSRAQPELRRGFDDRFGKEIMLRMRGLELDLHRTFVEGAYGLTVQLDDLFAPPYRFPLGVCELEALPMPQSLLHACYAAAFGDWPPRLGSLRDVAQLVHRERPNLVDVLMMAKAWRCEPVVAVAVVRTWDELALTTTPPIVEWARRFEPNAAEQRLLRWHQGAARAFTRHLAALVVLHDRHDRLAYLQAIMFPQRSYLDARGLSAVGNARHRVGACAGSALMHRTRGYHALAFDFSLVVEDADLAARLESLLAGFAEPLAEPEPHEVLPGDDGAVRMWFDGEQVLEGNTTSAFVGNFVQWINQQVMEPDYAVMCHAGGVARRGLACVLPAHMESGKTTLTTGLVRAGYDYVTDEAVSFALDTGEIEPYPKPLSIDPGSQFLFPELAPLPSNDLLDQQWQVPPDAIRPGAVAGRCRARWVVFPKYEAGTDTCLTPMSRAEGLVEVAKNTFRFREHPRRSLDVLARVIREVDCYRLRVGDLDAACALIDQLYEGDDG